MGGGSRPEEPVVGPGPIRRGPWGSEKGWADSLLLSVGENLRMQELLDQIKGPEKNASSGLAPLAPRTLERTS